MNILDGLRVTDLTLNLAGPYSTQILADLGADVIKVEPPDGDPARGWGPPFWGDEAPLFLSSNRNKRSVIVDLKSTGGQEVMSRLVSKSDVFVQAFRKGVIDSLGFDYESLKSTYPRLIYASVTGFGSKGPLAEAPGYDPLIQAYSGMMSITGHSDSSPARCGASVVDLGTGMLMALGVLAALRERDKTGRGSHVEASLLDTSMAWIGYHLYGFLASGQVPQRWGSGIGMIAPYEALPTRDGELMIAGGNNAIFSRLCDALGLEETVQDVRFCDNESRVMHRHELLEVLSSRTRSFLTVQLRALLERHRVPCSPIQNLEEVVRDPQVQASSMLEPYPHPRIPDYQELGFPLRFDGHRPRTRIVPPLSGEHSIEVLGELGYSSSEIDRFVRNRDVLTENQK